MDIQVIKLKVEKEHKYLTDFGLFSKNAMGERNKVTAIR
jgi:hypothetical protein